MFKPVGLGDRIQGGVVRKIFFLILCATFIMSCGPDCSEKCSDSFDVGFYYSGGFPIRLHLTNDDQQEVIQIYNQTFGIEIFKSVEHDEIADFEVSDSMIDVHRDYLGFTNLQPAYAKIQSGTIYLNSQKINLDKDFYKKVFAHELGHALGAKHFCDCVMMPCAIFSESISDAIKKPSFSNWLFEIYGLEIAQGVSDE